jgi:hypothetical protein
MHSGIALANWNFGAGATDPGHAVRSTYLGKLHAGSEDIFPLSGSVYISAKEDGLVGGIFFSIDYKKL